MRSIVWLLLLFAVAVVAALTLGDNDGLVSLYGGGWRVDLSLNLFVLGIVAAGFVVVGAVNAIGLLLKLPVEARRWRAMRRERAAQAALREAMAEYFAGRYTRAHKAAQRATDIREGGDGLPADTEFELLALMLAGGSLHRLQDRARRDEVVRRMLKLARRGGPRAADDGARLLAAEWALDDRDAARAETLLAELPPGVARRTQALRLKLQAARLARRPQDALPVARMLANHQAFTPAVAQGLLRSLAYEVLDSVYDSDQLRKAWEALDAEEQRDAFIAARAARRAAAMGVPGDGRLWLRPQWDRLDEMAPDERTEVALALADASAGIGPEWLPRLEAALRAFPAEVGIQAAAGAVFAERGLWGKARGPLEVAAASGELHATARRHAWRRLAALAREEGDERRAADCEHEAAQL